MTLEVKREFREVPPNLEELVRPVIYEACLKIDTQGRIIFNWARTAVNPKSFRVEISLKIKTNSNKFGYEYTRMRYIYKIKGKDDQNWLLDPPKIRITHWNESNKNYRYLTFDNPENAIAFLLN
jgi:hypothetical protein